MAVSIGWRLKRRTQRLIFAIAVSALGSLAGSVRADIVFYQPLVRDQHLTTAQWQQILTSAQQQGMTALALQWGQHGEVAFYAETGAAAALLAAVEQMKLPLWLGLYADPLYFQTITATGTDKKKYFKQQLNLSLEVRRKWLGYIARHPLQLQGWYFPMELNDTDFTDAAYVHWLRAELKRIAQVLEEPLAISLYYNDVVPVKDWLAAAEQIAESKLQLWVQDGYGVTQAQSNRALLLTQLPCSFSVIAEQFKQVSAPDEIFRARPLTAEEQQQQSRSCHPRILFELRYMPAAEGLLPLTDPIKAELNP